MEHEQKGSRCVNDPRAWAVKNSRWFVQFLSMSSQLWPLSSLGRTLFLGKLSPLLLLPMCLLVQVLVLGHKKLETPLDTHWIQNPPAVGDWLIKEPHRFQLIKPCCFHKTWIILHGPSWGWSGHFCLSGRSGERLMEEVRFEPRLGWRIHRCQGLEHQTNNTKVGCGSAKSSKWHRLVFVTLSTLYGWLAWFGWSEAGRR